MSPILFYSFSDKIIINFYRSRKLPIFYHVTHSDQSEAHRILRSYYERALSLSQYSKANLKSVNIKNL